MQTEENRYVCPYCGVKVEKDQVLFWEQVSTMYTDNIRGNFLRRHGVRVSSAYKFPRMYYRVKPDNIVAEDEFGFPTMIEDHLGNAMAPEELEKTKKSDQNNGFDDDFDSDYTLTSRNTSLTKKVLVEFPSLEVEELVKNNLLWEKVMVSV